MGTPNQQGQDWFAENSPRPISDVLPKTQSSTSDDWFILNAPAVAQRPLANGGPSSSISSNGLPASQLRYLQSNVGSEAPQNDDWFARNSPPSSMRPSPNSQALVQNQPSAGDDWFVVNAPTSSQRPASDNLSTGLVRNRVLSQNLSGQRSQVPPHVKRQNSLPIKPSSSPSGQFARQVSPNSATSPGSLVSTQNQQLGADLPPFNLTDPRYSLQTSYPGLLPTQAQLIASMQAGKQAETPTFRAVPPGSPDAWQLRQQQIAADLAVEQERAKGKVPLLAPSWWEDVVHDINWGSGKTFVGRGLNAIGRSEGILSDPDYRGAAPIVAGPLIGVANAGLGSTELGHGEFKKGLAHSAAGIGQVFAPFSALNPEIAIASRFLPEASIATVAQHAAAKTVEALGGDPETFNALTNLAGIGLTAYGVMRSQRPPSFESWRDSNFIPAEGQEGTWLSESGNKYTDRELLQIHETLKQNAANPYIKRVFAEIKIHRADYLTWRAKNFVQAADGLWGRPPFADRYTEGQLQEIFNASFPPAPKDLIAPASQAHKIKLTPYGGSGGGHHLPAQATLKGAPAADVNVWPAMSNPELRKWNLWHPDITAAQRRWYMAFGEGGERMEWEDAAGIETQSLLETGIGNADTAADAAQRSVNFQRKSGISAPTWIPWVGPNPDKH